MQIMKARKSFRWMRNMAITMEVIEKGRTLASLAEEHGLSIERIRMIVFATVQKADKGAFESAIADSPRSHRIPILRDHRAHFVPALERYLPF